MAADIRFYLDENVPVATCTQLNQRGIDCITARDLVTLGDSDENHLTRATTMERVLCTHDTDLLRLAAAGTPHAGIVFAPQRGFSVGAWVKGLELMSAVYSSADMRDHIEYL